MNKMVQLFFLLNEQKTETIANRLNKFVLLMTVKTLLDHLMSIYIYAKEKSNLRPKD